MNKKRVFGFLALSVGVAAFFSSCKDSSDVQSTEVSTGVYVLNEGKYGGNNAGLTYYDFATSAATSDIFASQNGRGLGDTGQDMIQYGSKIYIAVYKSSLIEVVDAKTATSIASISMVDGEGAPESPRSLTAANGKVNVVLYTGYVAQLDTTTLTVGSKIAVGANPDASVISNNKLYVANTGGMAAVNDSTISVIDLSTFTETKKIVVNLNPGTIQADSEGDIYVVSNGNYYDIPGKFQRIDATTNAVTDIDLSVKNFVIVDDKAYIYNFEYDENWQATNKTIAVYDVKSEALVTSNLVTSTTIDKTPYAIGVDPTNGDVYLGVTDYVNLGQMYCFDKTGALRYTFNTGINPSKILFITADN